MEGRRKKGQREGERKKSHLICLIPKTISCSLALAYLRFIAGKEREKINEGEMERAKEGQREGKREKRKGGINHTWNLFDPKCLSCQHSLYPSCALALITGNKEGREKGEKGREREGGYEGDGSGSPG